MNGISGDYIRTCELNGVSGVRRYHQEPNISVGQRVHCTGSVYIINLIYIYIYNAEACLDVGPIFVRKKNCRRKQRKINQQQGRECG